MREYAKAYDGPSLASLVNHDDNDLVRLRSAIAKIAIRLEGRIGA
jgi:hypothetical protein